MQLVWLSLVFGACTPQQGWQSPLDTAANTVAAGSHAGPVLVRAPEAGLTVVFHDASGRPRAITETDASGLAHGHLRGEGMVTLVGREATTVYGVQPHDELRLGPTQRRETHPITVTVSWVAPPTPDPRVVFDSTCGTATFIDHLAPGRQRATFACPPDQPLDLLAFVRADGQMAVSSAAYDLTNGDEIVLSSWESGTSELELHLEPAADTWVATSLYVLALRRGEIVGSTAFTELPGTDPMVVQFGTPPAGFADEYGVSIAVRSLDGGYQTRAAYARTGSPALPLSLDIDLGERLDAEWTWGGDGGLSLEPAVVLNHADWSLGTMTSAEILFLPRNSDYSQAWNFIGPPDRRVFRVPTMPSSLRYLVPDRDSAIYDDRPTRVSRDHQEGVTWDEARQALGAWDVPTPLHMSTTDNDIVPERFVDP